MRISPINAYGVQSTKSIRKFNNNSQVQFQGLKGAKSGAAVFGAAAALGAIGGSIIMTGGIAAIPLLATYIGIGAGSGAVLGYILEEGAKEAEIQEKEKTD